MAQQKSERREVPHARRKAGVTGRVEAARGGKGAPVEEATGQLGMNFGTAECPKAQARRSDGEAGEGPLSPVTRAVPKPKVREEKIPSTLMGVVCKNLEEAFQNGVESWGSRS
jgi:hypothetical protein